MIITEIEEASKSRCRIITDQEAAFVLYKGDLRIYHLKKGEEIPENTYRELMEEVLPKRAKLRSLNLLKTRDYTEQELRRKLRAGGYPGKVIDLAVDYVKSYGYVGDAYYARKYIETYREVKSRRRIEQELAKKGISGEIVGEIYEELTGEEDPELAQIDRLIQKKGFQVQNAAREQQYKLFGYLVRKGYSVQKIKNRIGNFDGFDDI